MSRIPSKGFSYIVHWILNPAPAFVQRGRPQFVNAQGNTHCTNACSRRARQYIIFSVRLVINACSCAQGNIYCKAKMPAADAQGSKRGNQTLKRCPNQLRFRKQRRAIHVGYIPISRHLIISSTQPCGGVSKASYQNACSRCARQSS